MMFKTSFQPGSGNDGPTTLSLGTFGGCGDWWAGARLPGVWNVTATGLCGLNWTVSTAATLVTIGPMWFPDGE